MMVLVEDLLGPTTFQSSLMDAQMMANWVLPLWFPYIIIFIFQVCCHWGNHFISGHPSDLLTCTYFGNQRYSIVTYNHCRSISNSVAVSIIIRIRIYKVCTTMKKVLATPPYRGQRLQVHVWYLCLIRQMNGLYKHHVCEPPTAVFKWLLFEGNVLHVSYMYDFIVTTPYLVWCVQWTCQ